ncbi:DUF397 domain-containing protein [Streptomyces sp. NPDC056672]|uniref:DUF397 domain-containing protein n=1 Tax=Streptomyces sp. NPDC056672 TaxID=3345906 RepID=UPI00368BD782
MSTTPDLSRVEWVKSSYSGNGGGSCIEWAPVHAQAHGVVPVRDSKVPEGPALFMSAVAWSRFVDQF